jgi:uncharacterized protein YggE
MNPKIRIVLVLVIASILSSATLFADKHEDSEESRRILTVEGEGKVQAVPDIATLSVAVNQEGEDLDPVMAKVRHDMGKILEAVKAQGIEDKDVQTEIFNVRPKFEYDKHTNPRRVGYVVTNQVTVKVRDLKKVGKVLAAVTAGGATDVNGPDFEVDNPQTYQRKALTLAFEDARSKASALADAAGVHLGQIVSMAPGAINRPMPRIPYMMRPMGSLAATVDTQEPIASGEQTLSATVTVVYALQ